MHANGLRFRRSSRFVVQALNTQFRVLLIPLWVTGVRFGSAQFVQPISLAPTRSGFGYYLAAPITQKKKKRGAEEDSLQSSKLNKYIGDLKYKTPTDCGAEPYRPTSNIP